MTDFNSESIIDYFIAPFPFWLPLLPLLATGGATASHRRGPSSGRRLMRAPVGAQQPPCLQPPTFSAGAARRGVSTL